MDRIQTKNSTSTKAPKERTGLFSTLYPLPSTISPRGFTILFAVLISSIMLTVGIAIFNITVRELRLSSIVRDSEKAIYAADAGTECALYYAFKLRWLSPTQAYTWNCSGQNFSVGNIGYAATSTFTINYDSNTRCVTVSVAQYQIPPLNFVRTVIEARGYNPCQAGPSRVERVYVRAF